MCLLILWVGDMSSNVEQDETFVFFQKSEDNRMKCFPSVLTMLAFPLHHKEIFFKLSSNFENIIVFIDLQ